MEARANKTQALALKAETIITGDRSIGAIMEYMGIKILTPQQILKNYEI